jgi:penicillin-binding protein 1C
VELVDGALLVRVGGGVAPFTWLADGLPVAVSTRARDTVLDLPGAGFVTLSVIDATGQSARTQVRVLRP